MKGLMVMGRPMGGGSGGGSGGGFRPSRPSGGSGGRPMGGGSGGSRGGGSMGGGHRPPPPPRPSHRPPPPPPRYGGGYGAPPPPPGGGYRRSRGGCLSGIISLVAVFLLAGGLFALNSCLNIVSCLSCSSCRGNGGDFEQKPSSSAPANPKPGNSNNNNDTQITVTKNSPANSFDKNCIVDETGFFDNPSKFGGDLEFFYNKYGIQPYVVFKVYDSSVTTDKQREDYCKQWYTENIKDDDTFLVMYFSEKNDDDVGYFAYYGGGNVSNSTDKLAKPFEEGINKYWFNENLSLDDVMLNSFKYAAGRVKVK